MGVGVKIAGISLAFASIGGAAGYAYVHQSAESLPPETPEAQPFTESYICFAEYPNCTRELGAMAILSKGNQIPVTFDQISPHLINALVATEDGMFWQHNGVDDLGIVRAVKNGIVESVKNKSPSFNEGGSTIEMQLARNLYLEDVPKNDLERKKWEISIALELDKTYSKQEIITKYVNVVNSGRGAFGAEMGSRMLFGKSVTDLTVYEAATWVALLKDPNKRDGNPDPEINERQMRSLEERRNKVLYDMVESDMLTQSQYETYSAIPVEDYVLPYHEVQATGNNFDVANYIGAQHAVTMILNDVKEQTGYSDDQLRDGLRINSTISFAMQASVVESAKTVGDYERDGRQIAVVAMGKQGDILGLYGGDYSVSQVNLATAPSPTGSGDKWAFYTNWLEKGIIQPDQIFEEQTSVVWEKGGANGADYVVSTGAHCSNQHACSLHEAIAKSSNPIPLQIAEDHPESIQQTYDMLQAFGVHSNSPVVPASVLGAREATLLDRTNGMTGLIANKGAAVRHFIVRSISKVVGGSSPKTLFDTQLPHQKQVVSQKTAEQMTQLLRGVARAGGTAGKKLNDLPTDVAGKTGTHDSNLVAAFYGTACLVSPVNQQNEDITVGVMERYVDTLSSLGKGQTGGNVPAAVFRATVDNFLPSTPCKL